jgi:glucose/arabinose dehydrogenase
VYIADEESHRVRRVDPTGTITTVVGNGDPGHPADGDRAGDTELGTPAGISTGPDGTLLITDDDTDQVYSVGTDGVLHVVAGAY